MNLDALRIEIDNVDEGIIQLLSKRFELTEQVGQFKAQNGIESLSPTRESEQFKRFEKISIELGLPYEVVKKVFEIIRDRVLFNHEQIKSETELKKID